MAETLGSMGGDLVTSGQQVLPPTTSHQVLWRNDGGTGWLQNPYQKGDQQGAFGATYSKMGVVPVQGVGGVGGVNPDWAATDQAAGGFNTPGYQYGAAPAGDIQNSVMNNAGQFNTGYIAPGDMPVDAIAAADPYVQKMQDAYYQQAQSRLDPQWQQTQADLESKLSNMGLTRGSEAWNRELDNMTRGRTDAYNQAQMQSILTSGAEAARMQGMDINAGNFANQAAQQEYQNRLASQQAQNQALTGQQAADMAAGNFANQAQNQAEQQAMQRASLNNAALAAQQNIQYQASGAGRKADAAARAAMSAANSGAYQAQLAAMTAAQNYGLQTRQLNNAEALQAFNMAQSAGMYPYYQQNAAMGQFGPTGMPTMPSYTSPGQIPSGAGNNAMINMGQLTGGMGLGSLGATFL